MTGLPAAFSALALASTASVADSEIADTRAETLLGMRTMLAGGRPPHTPPLTGGLPAPPYPPGPRARGGCPPPRTPLAPAHGGAARPPYPPGPRARGGCPPPVPPW